MVESSKDNPIATKFSDLFNNLTIDKRTKLITYLKSHVSEETLKQLYEKEDATEKNNVTKKLKTQIKQLVSPLRDLFSPQRIQARKDWEDLFENYQISRLGGGNNANYLFEDKKTNQKCVLQLLATEMNRFATANERKVKANSPSQQIFTTIYCESEATLAFKKKDTHQSRSEQIEYNVTLRVTEFCENGNLADYISRFDSDKKLEVLQKVIPKVIDILEELQRNNIVHTDMKFENFLVDAEGEVRLGDPKGLTKAGMRVREACITLGQGPEILRKDYCTLPDNPKTIEEQVHVPFLAHGIYLALTNVWRDGIAPKIWQMDHPVFENTAAGKNMKNIIERMTGEPDKLPTLAQVKDDLNRLFSPVNPSQKHKERNIKIRGVNNNDRPPVTKPPRAQ